MDMVWDIIVFLSVVCTAATVLAKYTETKKDDEILAKINKYLTAIAELKKPK